MRKNRLIAVGAVIFAIVLIACLVTSVNTPKIVMVKTDFVGICSHSLSAVDARLIKESGAGWVRLDANVTFNEAVQNAKTQNLSVLGILGSWMFGGDWQHFSLIDWQTNVTDYVTKYAGLVDAWEIWNEPSSPLYPVSAEKYFDMVQIASPIISQYDPLAKIVLFGGLNLFSGNDPNSDLDKIFAQQLASRNVICFGDAISLHAYPWGTSEPIVWEKYAESLNYYQTLFGAAEIWVTETGQSLEASTEKGQAKYLSDAYRFFSQGNISVARVFWYSLTDSSLDNASFGLTAPDNTRLAYQELQKMTRTYP
jgi:hypothetical protein